MKKENELYKRYRPRMLKDMLGQKTAVRKVRGYLKRTSGLPHVILFTGPSGCGKTTMARILKKILNCGDADFTETNGASFNGVKEARLIEQRMNGAPIDGDCRIWLIDECHRITDAAWDVLLKPLEDTPDHVYFFLCTSEPQKIKKTIQTRCNEVALRGMSDKDLATIVTDVCKKENFKPSKKLLNKIVEVADGSARQALVLLDGILQIRDENKQIDTLESQNIRKQSENIAKLLISKGGPKEKWARLKPQLLEMRERKSDPETIRRMLLGFITGAILKNSHTSAKKCFQVYDIFGDNYFNTGFAGLVFNCYEAIHGDPSDEN